MRKLRSRLAVATVIGVALCGLLSGLSSGRALTVAHPAVRQAIAGAPRGTPIWLAQMISRQEASFRDARPEKIVVHLGVIDRYGRVLDRVWMRGNFSCGNCTTGLRNTSWRGHIIGFTVSSATRRLLGFSLHRG